MKAGRQQLRDEDSRLNREKASRLQYDEEIVSWGMKRPELGRTSSGIGIWLLVSKRVRGMPLIGSTPRKPVATLCGEDSMI